jgi:hypothetical protein
MQTEKKWHTCNCTQQVFSYKEWCEFLENNDSKTTVFNFGKYSYNINDVCLNPDIECSYNDKNCEYRIYIAQSKFGWCWGYYCRFIDGGGCSGCHYYKKQENWFLTKKEAITAGLEYLLEMANKHLNDASKSNKPIVEIVKDTIIKEIANIKNEQLKLWN